MMAVLPDEAQRSSLASFFVALRRCISKLETLYDRLKSKEYRPVECKQLLTSPCPWPLYMSAVQYADR
jgi:hypothetical protein